MASWRSMTKIAGYGAGTISQRHGSADPYQNVMDPQHCWKHYPLNYIRYTGWTNRPTQGEVSGGGAPAQAVHPVHVESAGEVGEHCHRGKVNQLHGAVLKRGIAVYNIICVYGVHKLAQFLGLPDLDPLVKDLGTASKNRRKIFFFIVFWLFLWLLSFEEWHKCTFKK